MKKFFCLLGFFIITSIFVLPKFSFAETTGPNTPLNGHNDTSDGAGTISWTTGSNFMIDGASSASVSLGLGRTSKFLKLTNFGFSVPSDATINGITIDLAKKGTGSSISDANVSLVTTGATTTSKGDPNMWSSSFSTVSYGGDSDSWGRSWTPTDINDSNFGVVVSAYNNDPESSRTATIDGVSITVNYTAPVIVLDTTSPIITMTGGGVSLYVGDIYIDQGATAIDDKDGDITSKIATSSDVNTLIAGNYNVTYDVSDVAGNKAEQKIRHITVLEKPTPVIEPVSSNGGGGGAVGGHRHNMPSSSEGEVLGAFISKEDNFNLQIQFLLILTDYLKLLQSVNM